MNFGSVNVDSCWKLVSEEIWHNLIEVIVFSGSFPAKWIIYKERRIVNDVLECTMLGISQYSNMPFFNLCCTLFI